MPRVGNRLTVAEVRNAKPGRHGDGGGLYLLVRPASPKQAERGEKDGGRFWLFRYRPKGGKMREMGLGRAGPGRDAVTLAAARDNARAYLDVVRAGGDPLAKREAEKARREAEAQAALASAVTFRDAAARYIAAHEAAWRNDKHRAQWSSSLQTYAYPSFGDLPVGSIATGHVMLALDPIWRAKPETASRLRGRIEAVLDYAKVAGWREGENPARWRGHLANMLPKRSKVARVEHHAALPWKAMSGFMAELAARQDNGMAALALQFTILTAARSGETLGARWSEIDLADAVWTVPAERMKAGREHRVPLSSSALDVLRAMARFRPMDDAKEEAFVFPGRLPRKPLSSMSMAMLLRRMGRSDLTVHGFRSAFRDWASEATAFDRETAEAALAHTLRDKVEAAYRRGDLFQKRRRLMQAWADHCARPMAETGSVTPIRRTGQP